MYTSEGRRLRKVHYRDSSGVKEADTTYYIYDGMFAVAELDGHLDLQSKYIYTNGMLAGRINDDDELFQYFHDGLGSITMICDSTGEYQNLYVYDDFGDFRMLEEAGAVPNSYYYTGQERDESPSGLYNLRARYYATGIGRFTQEDPLSANALNYASYLYGPAMSDLFGEPSFLNRYVYVENNPVTEIDPLGLWRKSALELYYRERAMKMLAEEHYTAAFIDVYGMSLICFARCMFWPSVESVGMAAGGKYFGRWGAMGWLHYTDKRFKAWGRASKILVPKLAAKITTVLSAAGWAWTSYDAYKCIRKCQEVDKSPYLPCK